jgi:hypothetical protein
MGGGVYSLHEFRYFAWLFAARASVRIDARVVVFLIRAAFALMSPVPRRTRGDGQGRRLMGALGR